MNPIHPLCAAIQMQLNMIFHSALLIFHYTLNARRIIQLIPLIGFRFRCVFRFICIRFRFIDLTILSTINDEKMFVPSSDGMTIINKCD